eukprot:3196993-Lingulodinium_polyedra.AAC.1
MVETVTEARVVTNSRVGCSLHTPRGDPSDSTFDIGHWVRDSVEVKGDTNIITILTPLNPPRSAGSSVAAGTPGPE